MEKNNLDALYTLDGKVSLLKAFPLSFLIFLRRDT